jgi:hypothetical protein
MAGAQDSKELHHSNSSGFRSVLWIGDSQTHFSLGEHVYPKLISKFGLSEVSLYGVGGSSPRHWGQPRSIASENFDWLCDQSRMGRVNEKGNILIESKICRGPGNITMPIGFSVMDKVNHSKPDLVVFQFLGNSMGLISEAIRRNVSQLLKSLDFRQECIFVSSPPFHKDLEDRNQLRAQTEMYLADAVGNRCKFIYGMRVATLMRYERSFYNEDKVHLNAF